MDRRRGHPTSRGAATGASARCGARCDRHRPLRPGSVARALVTVAVLVLAVGAPIPAHADAIRDGQWHLKYLEIKTVHSITTGEGVLVGLPDTGVDVRDPDLAGLVTDGTTTGNGGDPRRD